MTKKTTWILGGTAALLIAGSLYAVPALAKEQFPSMMGTFMGGNIAAMHQQAGGNMAAMHQQAGGNMAAMHQQMGGDMLKMHDAMAPLMNEMPAMHEQAIGDVAKLLGLTADELNKALADGKSIAALAEEQKVSLDEIRNVMTQNMTAFLDKAVEAGTLTREQADQMLQFHQQHSEDCLSGQNGNMMQMHQMMLSQFNGKN